MSNPTLVPPLQALLDARLSRLDADHLLRPRWSDARERATAAAAKLQRPLVDLSTNDYLGFAQRAPSQLTPAAPAGAGASRLIHGTHPAHRDLEQDLAAWLGAEDALLFSSGYAANVGLVSALAAKDDLILSDSLNHASLIDGARLSRAQVIVLPHRDLGALQAALAAHRQRTIWFLTEAYFSMDGTVSDLTAISELLAQHPNAFLLLDEAHSLGAFGSQGRGLSAELRPRPAAIVGTFGKAFGLHGAFVAGSRSLCQWLTNRARSYVYSTATPPLWAQITRQRLTEVRHADAARDHLHRLTQTFHDALRARFPRACLPGSAGPITPLIVGDERQALSLAESLIDHGMLTQAIRPPTVPRGTARLRLTLHAGLAEADLAFILDTLQTVF